MIHSSPPYNLVIVQNIYHDASSQTNLHKEETKPTRQQLLQDTTSDMHVPSSACTFTARNLNYERDLEAVCGVG